MKEFLEALKTGNGYDYIANHSYEMTKDELATILKEYIYQINSMGICDGKEDVLDAVYENLLDYVDEE